MAKGNVKMTNNVIAPVAFAAKMDEAKLKELKEQGLLVKDAGEIDELDLPEPQYGDTIIGTLTNEEAELFVTMDALVNRLDELRRENTADWLKGASEAVRHSKEKEFEDGEAPILPENAVEFYRTSRQYEYIRGLFFWSVCSRLECYDYKVGVRSKRRIVKNERMW